MFVLITGLTISDDNFGSNLLIFISNLVGWIDKYFDTVIPLIYSWFLHSYLVGSLSNEFDIEYSGEMILDVFSNWV